MWQSILLKILPLIISVLTPTLKEMLTKFVEDFAAKAKTTPNPWDDIAAEILRDIFCPKP